MPAKIRLQRRGKKGQPFYHIIIADGRAPRDGRFIENIGTYNPLTKPAEINIDLNKAIEWLQNGAQPTDTVRAILSYTGVLYKNHLLKGMKKGALTEEQVEAKFEAWKTEKETKISSARKEQELKVKENRKKAIAEEVKVNQTKAQAIAEKLAKAAESQAEAAAEAAAVAEVSTEAAAAETEQAPEAEASAEPKE
jgi:small subunit ribosomal protein S16